MAHRTLDHSNEDLFKNRLFKLMESNGYDTSGKLAEALYDNGLIVHKSRVKEPLTEDEKREYAIKCTEKKINVHLNANTPQKVQSEFISAHCKLFSCSADYLFGFTRIKSSDINVRKLCVSLGISEKAAENMTCYGGSPELSYLYNSFWSSIIETDSYCEFPDAFSRAYREAVETISAQEAIEALVDVLKDEDPKDIAYNLLAARQKTYEGVERTHYSSFYGMLYKITKDFSDVIEAIVEKKTIKNNDRQKELDNWRRQLKMELAAMKGEGKSIYRQDGEFHFNKHPIV